MPRLTEVFKEPVRRFVTAETLDGEKKTIDVQKSIKDFKKTLDRIGFKRENGWGNCHAVSRWFIGSLGLVPKDVEPDSPELERYIRKQGTPLHHWVNIDGLNIDWTSHQFEPDSEYPKVWED